MIIKNFRATIKTVVTSFALLLAFSICAQTPEKAVLLANAQIDEGVVKKDIQKLELLYADDFVFTHGTGFVEGKASWLKNIQNPEVQLFPVSKIPLRPKCMAMWPSSSVGWTLFGNKNKLKQNTASGMSVCLFGAKVVGN